MSELRRDPITGRWTIIETLEPSGPEVFEVETDTPAGGTCPFCPGNEAMTPPEVYALRPAVGAVDGPGWRLRVVPNKFPALDASGMLTRRGLGVFDQSSGVGVHEIIVETPDHQRQLADLSQEELRQVITSYQLRTQALRADARLKYGLVFKNSGLVAGATLTHSYSQLIALPIVPKRVEEELRGAERYFEARERCVFCDIASQELLEDERVVCENRAFLAVCPYVSRFPFEMWVLPKEHLPEFALATQETVTDFARIVREVLGRLREALKNAPYNFVIHTAPFQLRDPETYHWHLEIIPALTRVAGFEWGTGFYINPTPPEYAAQILRGVALPV
ncbi:MAG TPA: galactose-1-phosphate uridylyltransferase [bacterium]